MASDSAAPSAEEWSQLKEKCLSYDKSLQTLKNLSKKGAKRQIMPVFVVRAAAAPFLSSLALIEFEQLKAKYNEVRNDVRKNTLAFEKSRLFSSQLAKERNDHSSAKKQLKQLQEEIKKLKHSKRTAPNCDEISRSPLRHGEGFRRIRRTSSQIRTGKRTEKSRRVAGVGGETTSKSFVHRA